MKKTRYDESKGAYDQILSFIEENKQLIELKASVVEEIMLKHLFAIELQEKYNLNIHFSRVYSCEYIKINENMGIGYWGEKFRRTISWSDNRKQPENELLLYLSFSTGAYVFGDTYLEGLFREFWAELLTYNPKYIDSANKYMYFSIDKASEIFNDYDGIFFKYQKRYRKEAVQEEIEKLRKKLDVLSKEKEMEEACK